MLPIAGFLFDIDGTLIDSNDAHARAWRETLTEGGFNVPLETIRSKIGMGGDHLLPELISVSSQTNEGRKLEKRRGEIFRANYLPTLRAFPRARELLETLKAKDYQIAVATSASGKDLKQLLQQTGLDGLFDAKANSSDVEHSKPHPDIIEAALTEAKLDFRRAVMVGDTPYDIAAAAGAHVRTIAVTCGGWNANRLRESGAWKIYADPADLLSAVISGSALF